MRITCEWNTIHLLHGTLLLLGDAPTQGLADRLGTTSEEMDRLESELFASYSPGTHPAAYEFLDADARLVGQAIPACLELMPHAMIETMIGCDIVDLEQAQREIEAAMSDAGWTAVPP